MENTPKNIEESSEAQTQTQPTVVDSATQDGEKVQTIPLTAGERSAIMKEMEKLDLKTLREASGLSLEFIAARLGYSSRSVWSWEENGKLPKNPLVRRHYLRLLGLKPSVTKVRPFLKKP